MTKEQYRALKRTNNDGITERQCTRCKEWKIENTDNFYMMNKRKPEKGFTPECKTCSIKRSKAYIQEHHDEAMAYKEQWKKENRETQLNYMRDFYKNNKEYRREYMSEWQRNNPDKIRDYNKQHSDHKITTKEWNSCKEYFNNSCAYCGLSITEHYITRKGITKLGDLHKDHYVHQGSNGLENCVPACNSCNSKKHDLVVEEWYNENNPIFSTERLGKIMQWLNGDYEPYIINK